VLLAVHAPQTRLDLRPIRTEVEVPPPSFWKATVQGALAATLRASSATADVAVDDQDPGLDPDAVDPKTIQPIQQPTE
jgi:hypothetical protein